jgi:AraC-like DNA-binding protein
MQGVPLGFEHAVDRAEFRPLAHRAGIELFRAHIVRYAFEPHSHAAFGLGVIASGAERFVYRGSQHLAGPGSLVLMNPDELHTGRAAAEGGWAYRMIYIDAPVLRALTGAADLHFAQAVQHDRPRAAQLNSLLQRLWQTTDALAADETLATLAHTLLPLARSGPATTPARARFAAVITHMQERLDQPLTLDELAGVAGLSPFHFLRSFRAQHHVTPRQMLMAERLLRAKQMLAAGRRPAEVAQAVGLADQSHLTRAFVQRYGVTPARYQQQSGSRPAAGRPAQCSA